MAIMTSFMRRIIVLMATTFSLTAAQDDRPYNVTDHFINPPSSGPKIETDPTVWESNNVYHVNEQLDLKWVTTRAVIELRLFRDTTDQSQIISGQAPNKQFTWGGVLDSSAITLDETDNNNVFFIVAYDAAEGESGDYFFYSHYFNLIKAAVPTSSSSSTTATTSTTASGPSSTISSTPSSAAPSSSPLSPSSNNAAAIGGGIGGGLGGALLILGAGFLAWRHHNNKKKRLQTLQRLPQQDPDTLRYAKPELDSTYRSSMHPSLATYDSAMRDPRHFSPASSSPQELVA